nr:carboxylesterase family protein [Pseudarthrobacter sulfonivorans]
MTNAGPVRGVWRGGSAAFYGIPFAEPPVGENRFMEPRARRPWYGVRDASRPGPTPQRRPFMAVSSVPEPSYPGDDTLLVNVFTSAPGNPDARLPVFVWIHGGAYVAGSPSSSWYDGRAFNRDGVVTVSISYRLGFDGFGSIPGAPENRAVRDWLAALEWVQENIVAFGGDPSQVTIGGQSAGGGAVLTLLTMPRAQHLFRAAIVGSGTTDHVELHEARDQTETMARLLGIASNREAFADLDEDAILDAQDVVAPKSEPDAGRVVANALGDGRMRLRFAPVVDGPLVEYDVIEAVRRGIGSDKPLLIGATAHEFNMIGMAAQDAVADTQALDLLEKFGYDGDFAKRFVRELNISTPTDLVGQGITERLFRGSTELIASLRTCSTWLYDFRWKSPTIGIAVHCLELPYVWDHLDAELVSTSSGDNPPASLAREIHSSWVRFITEGEAPWPSYNFRRSGRTFDVESRTVEDPYRLSRDFLVARTPDNDVDPHILITKE